ncbi:hypothetical protein HD806DRAFT_508051 [Xylariaceae sp. AK1471]|nr:hypothetical protein HD806DRAFT_508051 [Xylariaceae sp. AK1471]
MTYFGVLLNTVNWSLTALAGLFLCLRLYSKISRRRGLWWDDYLLIASFISLIIGVSLISSSILLGFADPKATISPAAVRQLQIHGGVQNVFFSLASDLSKTSFGFTLLRLVEGRIRLIVVSLTASLNIAYFLLILFTFFKCQPAIYSILPANQCWQLSTYIQFAIFGGAYSASVDFIFCIIPWFLVKDLNMKKAEKFGVAAAMSFGVVAGVTAVVKTTYLPLLNNPNFSSQATTLVVWYTAEAATTIVAASIPVLRALLKELSTSAARYFSGEKSDSETGKGSGSEGHSRKTQPSALHSSRVAATVSSHRKDPFVPLGDTNSDRSVFGGCSQPGRIVHTQEVRLSYHDRSDKDDPGYEMEVMARRWR